MDRTYLMTQDDVNQSLDATLVGKTSEPSVTDDAILDVQLVPIEKSTDRLAPSLPSLNDAHTSEDYVYTRKNLYHLLEHGKRSLDVLVNLAEQSEHPRAFEAVALLIKNLATANKELLELQQRVRMLQTTTSLTSGLTNGMQEKRGPTTVNNTLFVGSTNDLLKALKEIHDPPIIESIVKEDYEQI